MFQKFLKLIMGDVVLKAKRNQVALLLAKNYLHEREGVEALHPDLQKKIKAILKEMAGKKKPMFLFEGPRSWEQQDEYYAEGNITNARGGQSYHQYCLAADLIFVGKKWNAPYEWWEEFGKVAKKHNLIWGGDWEGFRDRPHVELRGTTWQELKPHFD